jgi:outer membrane protein assembly factor BamD
MRRLRVVLFGALLAACVAGCGGKNNPATVESDQVIYDRAMRQMEKNDYYKARRTLETIVNRGNQDPHLAPLVQLALADSYFGKKGVLTLTDAMSRYSTFLTFYPTHERADYAQYRLALCHLKQVYAPDRDQRETFTALEEFRKVLVQYPDSPYVDLAAEKINDCLELLAEHDYRVGNFYYDQEAYLGAIDRFVDILDDYPRYTRKDRVYYHLSDALIQTARSEEADVYLRKLIEAYPDSKYLKKAQELLKKIGGES